MHWYDLFAPVYNVSTLGLYRRYRREAQRQLRLRPGLTALDVACGTGKNFPLLIEGLGPTGTLIGVDYSAGMLAQARRRVQRRGWANVHLLQADAQTLSPDRLQKALGRPVERIDRVLCTLGLTAIPDWRGAFARTYDLLAPGGRYAIMDLYYARPTPGRYLMNAIGAADVSRRVWEPLQQQSQDYEEKDFAFFSGRIRIVSGSKPGEDG